MKTKFKDVAHLYLGCKIMWNAVEGFRLSRIENLLSIGKSSTVAPGDCVIGIMGEVYSYANFAEFQPILRPLSSMTDEQMIQLVKIDLRMYPNELRIVLNRRHNMWGFSAFDGENHLMTGGVSQSSFSPEQFQYLLSLHFDLFDLLKSGQAIDATTLNTNPYE